MSTLRVGEVRGTGKELGQSAPGAASATTLYTCPASSKGATGVVVSIANRSTASTYRVWVAKAAAGDANAQYRRYDTAIGANGFDTVFIGDLEPTDLLRVYGGSANISFVANGIELA